MLDYELIMAHVAMSYANPRLDMGRASAMTRTKKLQLAAQLERKFGTDASEIVHPFNDGWSIRRPQTYGDLNREGELMSNCWAHSAWTSDRAALDPERWRQALPYYLDHQDPEDPSQLLRQPNFAAKLKGWGDPRVGVFYAHSLRDPDNLPAMSFYVPQHNEFPPPAQYMAGGHNSDPKPQHVQRVNDWWGNQASLGDMGLANQNPW